MEALLRAGRLYLSLQDAVALALENNLDIELQRYGPRSGGSGSFARARPVVLCEDSNWHLAGPDIGGQPFDGRRSRDRRGRRGWIVRRWYRNASSGGATVLFTGTQVPTLDEVAFVNYSWGHRTSVQSNTLLTGTSSLVFEGGQLNVGHPERLLVRRSGADRLLPAGSGFEQLRVAIINPFGTAA